jgi:predicted DCC family thiol-disulfide oxidoreductase YuxK
VVIAVGELLERHEQSDPQQRFRFARLQSTVAQQLLTRYNATDNNLDSVVLIYKGRLYRNSRAALAVSGCR